MICDLSKSFYLFIILSKLCSVHICHAFKFDSFVLIESDLALAFNKSHYWTWNITQSKISEARQIATDFSTPIEYIWIPYAARHSNISHKFELEYGKVCIRSNGRNDLFIVSFNQSTESLKIEKRFTNYCDRHILMTNYSSCTTIIPLIRSDLNFLNGYNGTYLVGHGEYSFIVFQQKHQSVASEQIIIPIKLLDNSTRLTPQLCLKNLENLINLKKVTTITLTGLKTIVPSQGGNIYIFFENQYCIANIDRHSDCYKKSLSNLSSKIRAKREINSNSTENKELLDSFADRQTYPTTLNDYRSGIAIVIIFVISIIIIAAYKLILIT